MTTPCPCGRPANYADCCGRYIDGGLPADTAEALMRSRYTAYALGEEAYLLATWHPLTRPSRLDLLGEPPPRWLALKVLRHEQQDADHATVAFVARYKIAGRAYRLEEVSRFVREAGRWYYVDGQIASR